MTDWHRTTDEQPKFPEGRDSMTCNVVTDKGVVMSFDWCRSRYAKTERGRAPRWNWHGRGSPWPVVWWAYLPPPPDADEGGTP